MISTRGEVLKTAFNQYWTAILGKSEDYFSYMTNTNFDMLKMILSNINNIIAYSTTLRLAEFLIKKFSLSNAEGKLLLDYVENTNSNANGYDIFSEEIKIIAEIKCNRPVKGGNRFGAAQKKGITDDIKSLLYGKSKSSIGDDLQNYYKFLGVYRFDSKTDEAIGHYLAHLPGDLSRYVELLDNDLPKRNLKKDTVYVVIVTEH